MEEEEDLGPRPESELGIVERLAKTGERNYKVEKVFLLIIKKANVQKKGQEC